MAATTSLRWISPHPPPLPATTRSANLCYPHSLTLLRKSAVVRFSPSPLLARSYLRRKDCLLVACLPSTPPPPPPVNSGSSTVPTTRLYVSGLSFRTTQESLRNAFQNFGQLVEVNLVMDRIANRPRGFAFLRYSKEEEAKKAIEGMHGKFLDGRVIFVEVAKPRSVVQQSVKHTPRQY